MLSIIIIKYMIRMNIYISIKKVIVKGIQLHGNKTYTHFVFFVLSFFKVRRVVVKSNKFLILSYNIEEDI